MPTLQTQRQRPMASAYAMLIVLVVVALGAVVKADTASAFEVLAWSGPVQIDSQSAPSGVILAGLSCPTTNLCVAVDNNGNVLTSTNPTGGANTWTKTNVDAGGGGGGVFCLSASFCVVVDGGDVVTSTDPTGGSAAWTVATIGAEYVGFNGIACASTTLCVAGNAFGGLMASTNPTGGASEWHSVFTATEVDDYSSISCPSTSFCITGDLFSGFVTSTAPATKAWTATGQLEGGTAAVSCPSVSLCVGVGLGRVAISTNPTGGTSAWHTSLVDFGAMTSVSCPSTSQCDAVDDSGNVVEMAPSEPEGVGSSARSIDGTTSLTGVSCPSEDLCLAVDSKGNVLMGTPFVENDTLPQITGSPTLGSTLSASTGSWWGTPQSYAYQWLRDGSPIAGATSSTYVVMAADQGHQLAVEVTASDLTSTASATSAAVNVPAATPSNGSQNTGGGSPGNGGSSPVINNGGIGTITPPSINPAQIVVSLRKQLTPSGKAAKIGALLKNGGLTMPFEALEAGTVSVEWYLVPAGAKLAKKTKAKPVLVASGKLVFSAAGTGKLMVRLTAVGRRLLQHARRIRLVAKGTFVERGGEVAGATTSVTVGR
jgi:hypothetical protein